MVQSSDQMITYSKNLENINCGVFVVLTRHFGSQHLLDTTPSSFEAFVLLACHLLLLEDWNTKKSLSNQIN